MCSMSWGGVWPEPIDKPRQQRDLESTLSPRLAPSPAPQDSPVLPVSPGTKAAPRTPGPHSPSRPGRRRRDHRHQRRTLGRRSRREQFAPRLPPSPKPSGPVHWVALRRRSSCGPDLVEFGLNIGRNQNNLRRRRPSLDRCCRENAPLGLLIWTASDASENYS